MPSGREILAESVVVLIGAGISTGLYFAESGNTTPYGHNATVEACAGAVAARQEPVGVWTSAPMPEQCEPVAGLIQTRVTGTGELNSATGEVAATNLQTQYKFESADQFVTGNSDSLENEAQTLFFRIGGSIAVGALFAGAMGLKVRDRIREQENRKAVPDNLYAFERPVEIASGT